MIINNEFFTSIHISDFVLCTTVLETSTTICTRIVSIETHEATSWLCYTECTMDKCFDFHKMTFASHKLLWDNLFMDSFDLRYCKLTSEYDTVGKLCKKFHWLIVGDRKLDRDMDWYINFITILYCRKIECYDRIDIIFFRSIDEFTHNHDIMIIE